MATKKFTFFYDTKEGPASGAEILGFIAAIALVVSTFIGVYAGLGHTYKLLDKAANTRVYENRPYVLTEAQGAHWEAQARNAGGAWQYTCVPGEPAEASDSHRLYEGGGGIVWFE